MDEITKEQAGEALHQLIQPEETQPEPSVVQAQEAAPELVDAVETTPVAEEAAPEPETDDVSSLKKRLEEYEAKVAEKEKQYEARWKAFQDRSVQNEQILRDRYLRKASTADRALKILKGTRSEQGVPETEVDTVIREIESTMNPQSASYAPPTQPTGATEDQAITLNSFLNEKGMTAEEANEFGNWVRSEGTAKLSPREQAVAEQSLDGFLRIAHSRWKEDVSEHAKQTTRNDAVDAVKTVQRAQKDASRAASAAPSAPRKTATPTNANSVDIHKMPKAERDAYLSMLIKESMTENR